MKKIIIIGLFLLAILGLGFNVNMTKASAETNFDAAATAAIAVDSETGKILYAKNDDEKLGIASITKIITAYMVYDAVANGKLKWDDSVTISDYSYQLSQNLDLSGVPFVEGKAYTVKELLNAALVASANSAAVSLAEKVAGSEPAFVDAAKKLLISWGIKEPHLVNASGLNNEYLGDNRYPNSATDDENRLSAKDVAIIAQHLIQEYPEVLEITKQSTSQWEDVTMQTWNWMLPDMPNYREGVDGLKTGTTELAGQCFVGTATQDNQRIITVVLKATNVDSDSAARFTATNELMDYAFNNWSKQVIIKKGDTVSFKKSIKVEDGKAKSVKLVANSEFTSWVNTDWESIDYQGKFIAVKKSGALVAPVTALKTEAGSATIQLKDDNLGYLDSKSKENNKVVLVAKTDVAAENIIKLSIQKFINWVNEKL
ncbi:serine hydrolase [Enterococcus sp. MMGLQ5-1]|uniref:serine hydrolase n=1 Tax=Enterococcus sp. MMGLQ5-1 TaxID=2737663 RepID=UPI0015558136|nr:serine hydrolase [Enterococcus sp. MMGLQ5-1]MBS7578216.1 D-alanyl-D-alanine carboxypeptidase [Enterococcus sp. MMGLQ5-2]MBS7585408.1 D-alanyl-D-alanine carboxypeptidase [Enterococcus sp. MMGLQ5-1]NPD13265.1 D-alanyl-D-alanine carboxypeptidase [Enterococcus sp. MMGLQ5-1]NPD38047.1 D-alanyl-D-alanine carboxypeptidase [Enterococcus sp. MMGLQ5-2]